jgi:DNA excision repair protein ERCC-2
MVAQRLMVLLPRLKPQKTVGRIPMAPEQNNEDSPPIPPFARGDEDPEPDEIFSSGDGDDVDGVTNVELDSAEYEWTPYFRYETAYQDQIDAIDTFLDVLSDNGYYTFEGACGTGKTLAAVTAGLHAIRDQKHLTHSRVDSGSFPEYSRMLVVTPVKQQLRQFVEELRGVNKTLDNEKPVLTTVLRGRPDMMPYAGVDLPPFDEHSFGNKMEDLREMTRELIKFDSDIPINWPQSLPAPQFSKYDYDWEAASGKAESIRERHRYDPYRAQAVAHLVQNLEHPTGGHWEPLKVQGVETPYPEYIPHTNNVVDENELDKRGMEQLPLDLQGKFDPFYAGFFANGSSLPFDFDAADHYVFDQEAIITQAAGAGICPHEAMATLAEESDVVIGNYNHLYDPQTRLLTGEKIGILDDETIAVVDEAHQIESRARDMLSSSLDLYTLNRAINDIEILRQYAIGEHEKTPTPNLDSGKATTAKRLVKAALETAGSYSVTVEDISEVEQFLRFAKQKLTEYGADGLNESYEKPWQEVLDSWGPDTQEKVLLDPDETSGPDKFVEDVIAREDFSRDTFFKVYPVMLAAKFGYEALEEAGIHDRTPQGVQLGTFWKRWMQEDAVEYHREVVLESSLKDSFPNEFPLWVEGWTPQFQLFNCIPRDELRAVFSELGGGVLMSATLQPADVFREAVGIDDVPELSEDDAEGGASDEIPEQPESNAESNDEGEDVVSPQPPSAGGGAESVDGDGRASAFESYPLRFPREHRESMTVTLPKYTSRNRGSTTQKRKYMSDVREQYADALETLVGTRGNILVAMPNYGEAAWAYNWLQDRVPGKSFYLDQSSSDAETNATLESFFDDGDGVLFTSARGTITEGVDYDGEKLHACICVGIPLLPVQSPRIQAIKTAYDERIGSGDGFETALTIPAVRKVRQAFGRVIRGADEAGVRILLDERYASTDWDGVQELLSDQDQQEFTPTSRDRAVDMVKEFWDHADSLDLDEHSVATTAGEDSPPGGDATGSSDGALTTPESSGSAVESASGDEVETDSGDSYSKVYFGSGAGLSSWIPIVTDVVENEIIPLVRDNTVEDPESYSGDVVKLNFASELSANGWHTVEASTVRNEIEPIAEEARQ